MTDTESTQTIKRIVAFTSSRQYDHKKYNKEDTIQYSTIPEIVININNDNDDILTQSIKKGNVEMHFLCSGDFQSDKNNLYKLKSNFDKDYTEKFIELITFAITHKCNVTISDYSLKCFFGNYPVSFGFNPILLDRSILSGKTIITGNAEFCKKSAHKDLYYLGNMTNIDDQGKFKCTIECMGNTSKPYINEEQKLDSMVIHTYIFKDEQTKFVNSFEYKPFVDGGIINGFATHLSDLSGISTNLDRLSNVIFEKMGEESSQSFRSQSDSIKDPEMKENFYRKSAARVLSNQPLDFDRVEGSLKLDDMFCECNKQS